MPIAHVGHHAYTDGGAAPVVVDNVRHPAARRLTDVLRSRAARPRTVLVEDEENIAQAIRAGVQMLAVYSTPATEIVAARLHAQVPSAARFIIDDDVVRSLLAGDKTTSVLALARAPRPASWRDVAAGPGDLLVLDGVRITGNIGAMIRTAYAFGASGVVLVDSGLRTVYDRRVIRASRGLVFTLPVILADRAELERFLRSAGLPLVVMTASARAPLQEIGSTPDRLAILMGSERSGASRELDALASRRYAVPMTTGVDSLNVSVAAGLALYERRRGSG